MDHICILLKELHILVGILVRMGKQVRKMVLVRILLAHKQVHRVLVGTLEHKLEHKVLVGKLTLEHILVCMALDKLALERKLVLVGTQVLERMLVCMVLRILVLVRKVFHKQVCMALRKQACKVVDIQVRRVLRRLACMAQHRLADSNRHCSG
jgi:hypothetical protein